MLQWKLCRSHLDSVPVYSAWVFFLQLSAAWRLFCFEYVHFQLSLCPCTSMSHCRKEEGYLLVVVTRYFRSKHVNSKNTVPHIFLWIWRKSHVYVRMMGFLYSAYLAKASFKIHMETVEWINFWDNLTGFTRYIWGSSQGNPGFTVIIKIWRNSRNSNVLLCLYLFLHS